MSLLAQNFREKVSKSKDYAMKKEASPNVAYSTGFLSFDFRNGEIISGIDPKGNTVKYTSVGIQDGSMVMMIGRSGCGKTTFALQAAGNIVRPFKTSCIFHDDIEGGISSSRRITLTGLQDSSRYIHRNAGINAENFYERIRMIYDLKMQNSKDYEYDTGMYDNNGERVYKLEPTVYILDSLALLMPSKYTQEEELSGQMSSTAAAKTNSMVFKRLIPMTKAANIILLTINHINENVDINPMAKKKATVSYLKQDEALPRTLLGLTIAI